MDPMIPSESLKRVLQAGIVTFPPCQDVSRAGHHDPLTCPPWLAVQRFSDAAPWPSTSVQYRGIDRRNGRSWTGDTEQDVIRRALDRDQPKRYDCSSFTDILDRAREREDARYHYALPKRWIAGIDVRDFDQLCDNNPIHGVSQALVSVDGGHTTPLCSACTEAALHECHKAPMESYVILSRPKGK